MPANRVRCDGVQTTARCTTRMLHFDGSVDARGTARFDMFDLLGTDENDVTFAIGWLLRESPEFFRLSLRRVKRDQRLRTLLSSAFSDMSVMRIWRASQTSRSSRLKCM